MSTEFNRTNPNNESTRWKTYLWVLIATTIISVYTATTLIELLLSFKYFNDFSTIFILIPNAFLIFAWMYWFMMFARISYNLQSNRHYHYEEDYPYTERKLLTFYKMLDAIIAAFYITFLLSNIFLFSTILSSTQRF